MSSDVRNRPKCESFFTDKLSRQRDVNLRTAVTGSSSLQVKQISLTVNTSCRRSTRKEPPQNTNSFNDPVLEFS